MFMEDYYLKYLCFSLNDMFGLVRLHLYSCRDILDKLALFMEEFEEKVIQLMQCLVKDQPKPDLSQV